ncbi:MAG: DNA-deoxyinosine glycosylase [Elusimicrobia bacterium]|nr:DNA-deoxyinosine glycosylase [Elusimicrobiota bacterium]
MPLSFEPVVGPSPKILILGSMPGVESLRRQEYYGHPQNQFWRLLGEVIGTDLQSLSYAKRLSVLKKKGIALWDTIKACEREGSLDSDICDEEPNEISGLVRETGVRAVFLNGGKARQMFLRHIAEGLSTEVTVVDLPSSSPAAASIPYPEKLRRWRRIADFL